MEAARYVKSSPDHVATEIRDATGSLPKLAIAQVPGLPRLIENLEFAAKSIQVDPDASRGYLAGVAAELDWVASNMERAKS
jgi:hypothetical protein